LKLTCFQPTESPSPPGEHDTSPLEGTTDSSRASWQFTPPWTKLVAKNWRDFSLLPEMGGAECWSELVHVCVGWLSSTLVKTTHCTALEKLEESWNSILQGKISILCHIPALWMKGAGNCTNNISSQDKFWESACTRGHITPREAWIQTSWVRCPQSCVIGIHCLVVQYTNLEKR
jgi:hypothetical protein